MTKGGLAIAGYARLTILLLVAACGPTSEDGQAVGYVVGQISDASGAGVGGARVVIDGLALELDQPTTRQMTTTPSGQYSIVFSAFLRAAVSSEAIITVTAPIGSGLRDTVVTGVTFTVSLQIDTTTVDIVLSQ